MKVAVLLSGGVDSSVALCQLAQQPNVELTAYYLKIWLEDDLAHMGSCPWEEDLHYARAVCEAQGVPLEVISLQQEYWDRVVSYTIAELKAGRTPSPDLFCNQRVKFGAFVDKVGEGAFDFVASGHYATMRVERGRPRLFKGVDPVKDQTYFLSHLSSQQLARCIFPLGELHKTEVRGLAAKYNLLNQARADSQGICFLGKIKFNEFVKFHLGERRGSIVCLETGKKLGEHAGYWFHTIGQRKGLGLSGGPWFVVKKDIDENIVYVSHNETYWNQAKQSFHIAAPNWLADVPDFSRNYSCKIRHGKQTYDCTLAPQGELIQVNLVVKDAGVASGQFCVIYDDRECLGGGVIV